jgi:LemA protein
MEELMSDQNKSYKKPLITAGIILLMIALIFRFITGTYNKMITCQEDIKSAWSQVENQYQRRMDLIPNLVNTVKAYASHEQSLFTDIAEARGRLGGIVNIDSSITDNPEKMAEFSKAQNELGMSLQRLLALTENYPVLKANENFMSLQDELAGTENRIAAERLRYNDAVKKYNTLVRTFPSSIVASLNNFTAKAYFESSAGAEKAPEVKF